jgi:hypothetical protein
MIGIWAICRGAERQHNDAIHATTIEVLRRLRIDDKHTDFCNNLVLLIGSRD